MKQILFVHKVLNLPQKSIYFLNYVPQFVESILRRKFQLHDEAIDFIDANRYCQFFLNGVLYQAFGVKHDTFKKRKYILSFEKDLKNKKKYLR